MCVRLLAALEIVNVCFSPNAKDFAETVMDEAGIVAVKETVLVPMLDVPLYVVQVIDTVPLFAFVR